MRKLKNILQHRYLFKVSAIVCLILVIIFTNIFRVDSKFDGTETSFVGVVYKIKYSSDKTILYIKEKSSERLVINYFDILENISIGDKIEVEGVLEEPNNNDVFNLFNYKKYLYYNKIHYQVVANSVVKIGNNSNVLYYIKNKFISRINKLPKAKEYVKTFLLGDTSLIDGQILNSFRSNGISHLFSISGMHISLFASCILYILKRISYNNFYNYFIVINFLVFYMLLVGTLPSVVRSTIMYILFALNKVFNLKIKSIDILCILLIIMFLINPMYVYNVSFQYSYIISFSLILFNKNIQRHKNKIGKSLYISMLSFFVAFPITIYNYYKVNILGIFLNIVFIPFVSVIIFPLSIVSFIFPFMSYILSFFVNILEYVSRVIEISKFGIICFSKPNIYLIILYYIFIYMFLYNYKNVYIFVFILLHKYYMYFNPFFNVVYLSVGNGDSSLITLPYNKGNILIDTGGLYNYEIVKNKTIPYLMSLGITKVDYLITTHGDYDHMGEAINLVNNFKVEKVIFNCGEFNELEQDLIKALDKKKIPYYSCIKELNIDGNKLYFLNDKDYDNENDNSSVVYMKFNNHKFLFMGDAGVEVEEDLIEKYNLQDIDVLKVGHHGSKTSSSKNFINEINPKYSIISVGKNNRYGHPNKEVIDNLIDSKIYRTDKDGSIMFKIKNNKLKIETCSP